MEPATAIPDEEYKKIVALCKKQSSGITLKDKNGKPFFFVWRDGTLYTTNPVKYTNTDIAGNDVPVEKEMEVFPLSEVMKQQAMAPQTPLEKMCGLVRQEVPNASEEEVLERAEWALEVQASLKRLLESGIPLKTAYELLGVGLDKVGLRMDGSVGESGFCGFFSTDSG